MKLTQYTAVKTKHHELLVLAKPNRLEYRVRSTTRQLRNTGLVVASFIAPLCSVSMRSFSVDHKLKCRRTDIWR